MSYLESFISSSIVGLTMLIGSYAMLKLQKNSIKKELIAWIQTEQCAKIVYQMGALAAQGAKSGFGLGKTGGKFKWQDMFGQIAGNFLMKKMGMGELQQQPSEETKLDIS